MVQKRDAPDWGHGTVALPFIIDIARLFTSSVMLYSMKRRMMFEVKMARRHPSTDMVAIAVYTLLIRLRMLRAC